MVAQAAEKTPVWAWEEEGRPEEEKKKTEKNRAKFEFAAVGTCFATRWPIACLRRRCPSTCTGAESRGVFDSALLRFSCLRCCTDDAWPCASRSRAQLDLSGSFRAVCLGFSLFFSFSAETDGAELALCASGCLQGADEGALRALVLQGVHLGVDEQVSHMPAGPTTSQAEGSACGLYRRKHHR
jgi:hypothetical protein